MTPLILGACLAAAPAADRPINLVVIVADDWRWDCLRHAGNPIIQTPHLDALAADGVRFRNAFVTTSICALSRASILSGQYVRRHGITDFTKPFTPAAWADTYPARLRSAGYRTGFVGKFGVGNAKAIADAGKNFDYWRGLPGQAGPFFDPKDPTRTHATARFGGECLDFLRECEPGRPFCLSVSFSAPHARDGDAREFAPDSRDESLYAEVTIPPTATEADFHLLPEHARNMEGRKRWQRRFSSPDLYQRTVRDYYRLITGVDREIGRIRALLAERGLADSTVVVFTSDNGFFLGDRGMADKWLMYEPSIRVPLIVHDPRLPADRRGSVVHELALNVDVAPTLLELVRQPVPPTMQGRSVVPLLQGQKPADWRTDFFYEHNCGTKIIPPSEGVRAERWKYLRWMGTEPPVEELYDLQADPDERHNLAGDPNRAGLLKRLRGRWSELAQVWAGGP